MGDCVALGLFVSLGILSIKTINFIGYPLISNGTIFGEQTTVNLLAATDKNCIIRLAWKNFSSCK